VRVISLLMKDVRDTAIILGMGRRDEVRDECLKGVNLSGLDGHIKQ
jgi:hypothetical protein